MIDTTKKVTAISVDGVAMSVGGTTTTKSITTNGTYNASSDNVDGYSQVTVSVTPALTTKSITQNGTYDASSDSADGYSSVTVNVSGGGSGGVSFKTYAEARTDGDNLFYNFANLTTADASAYMDNVDTSSWTSTQSMFNGCSSLVQSPAMDLTSVTNISAMFSSCTSLTTVYAYNTSSCDSMVSAFGGCTALTSVPAIDYSFNANGSYLFQGCTGLITATFPSGSEFSYLDSMFESCTSLTSVSSFETGMAYSASNMFYNCYSLVTIGSLDFDSVSSDLSYMLYNCSSLESIGIYNIKVDWDISASEQFTASALSTIISNLGDVATDGNAYTGGNTATLTMGATNLAKLSQSDIDSATAKGWTLA